MQEPQVDGTNLQGLRYVEYMVNVLAESAKMYWRWWGPLGAPMIRLTEEWADAQRQYLKTLQKGPHSSGKKTFMFSLSQEITEMVDGGSKEAEGSTKEPARSAKESASEARRIAQEAERNAEEKMMNSNG